MKEHRKDQRHHGDALRDVATEKQDLSDAEQHLGGDDRHPGAPDWHPGDATAEVAACTAAAAHRRDHHHEGESQCCRPHCIQVVHLGQRAVAVCHDCQMDSGFLPHRDAERLAEQHRETTRTTCVPLPGAPAA